MYILAIRPSGVIPRSLQKNKRPWKPWQLLSFISFHASHQSFSSTSPSLYHTCLSQTLWPSLPPSWSMKVCKWIIPKLIYDLAQCSPNSIIILIWSRLLAISDHSSEMKSPQKQAFIKRLLQSSVAGDVPSWPPYFLSAILPLLPHLPVSHFQQLTSQQVSNVSFWTSWFFLFTCWK